MAKRAQRPPVEMQTDFFNEIEGQYVPTPPGKLGPKTRWQVNGTLQPESNAVPVEKPEHLTAIVMLAYAPPKNFPNVAPEGGDTATFDLMSQSDVLKLIKMFEKAINNGHMLESFTLEVMS